MVYKRRFVWYYELHMLKHKYGLSMQAWIYRAEEPKRLERLVVRALSEQIITQARADELLGRSLRHFYEEEVEQGEDDES